MFLHRTAIEHLIVKGQVGLLPSINSARFIAPLPGDCFGGDCYNNSKTQLTKLVETTDCYHSDITYGSGAAHKLYIFLNMFYITLHKQESESSSSESLVSMQQTTFIYKLAKVSAFV